MCVCMHSVCISTTETYKLFKILCVETHVHKLLLLSPHILSDGSSSTDSLKNVYLYLFCVCIWVLFYKVYICLFCACVSKHVLLSGVRSFFPECGF